MFYKFFFFWGPLLLILVSILVIYLLPDTESLFGFDIKPNVFKVDLPKDFIGRLQPNQLLSNAERLFINELRAPESFAAKNGRIFTGVDDGRIVELLPNSYRTVTFLPGSMKAQSYHDCRKKFFAVKHCSRAVGIRFSNSSEMLLYAVDSYYGIHEINVDSGASRLVLDVNRHRLPDGSKIKFLDDLVVQDINGKLVFFITQGSQRWFVEDTLFIITESEQTGKLLRFDTETETITILKDNLSFPNGIEFSNNKTALLFIELNKNRVLQYHLNETDPTKALKVLIDHLPGEADNIKRSMDQNRETFWVALFSGRNKQKNSFIISQLAGKPYLRRFLLRLLRLTGFLIQKLGELIGLDFLTEFGHYVRIGGIIKSMNSNYGLAIEIDLNGRIINSLHSPDAHFSSLSEVFEYHRDSKERHFYLGSYYNPYLGHLKVNIEDLQESLFRKLDETTTKNSDSKKEKEL